MWLLRFNHSAQCDGIKHVEHVTTICHLHRRSVGVGVKRDHLDSQALKLDHDLFPKLA